MEKTTIKYIVEGGHKLNGEIIVKGSKNAILPMIAASLLAKKGFTVIKNVPPLNDIMISLEIAKSIGADVKYYKNEQVVIIDASNISNYRLPLEYTQLLRASVLFLPLYYYA